MRESVRPYAAMKASGVKWQGEVPEHWEVRRLRSLGSIFNGATPSSNNPSYWDGDITWITPHDLGRIPGRSVVTSARKLTREGYDSCGAHIAGAGAVVVSTRAPIGHIGVLSVPACVNQGCRLVAPNFAAVRSEYVYFSLLTAQSELASLGNGSTFLELPRETLASFRVPLPPLTEQAAIVRFLEHADDRIQRYIRAKEKLIVLLEEQKKAVFQEVMTGRIDVRTGDRYPAYRNFAVVGLGAVPAHWEARRLKTVCQIRYGLGQPPPEHVDGLPLIRATNVSRGRITNKDLVRVDPSAVPASRNAVLSEGEIVVVRSGAYTADSAIVPKAYAGAISGYDMVVTAVGAQPEFVATALLCPYVRDDQLIVESMRSAQPHLNAEELGSAVLLLPPPVEQSVLVDYLGRVSAATDLHVARAVRQIELIRAFRARLIADAVTGKLDVRDAVVHLPEVGASLHSPSVQNGADVGAAGQNRLDENAL